MTESNTNSSVKKEESVLEKKIDGVAVLKSDGKDAGEGDNVDNDGEDRQSLDWDEAVGQGDGKGSKKEDKMDDKMENKEQKEVTNEMVHSSDENKDRDVGGDPDSTPKVVATRASDPPAPLAPPAPPPTMTAPQEGSAVNPQMLEAYQQWTHGVATGLKVTEQQNKLASGFNSYAATTKAVVHTRPIAPFPHRPQQQPPTTQFRPDLQLPPVFPDAKASNSKFVYKRRFYAVRRGQKGPFADVRAIFLKWEDCQKIVEGDDDSTCDVDVVSSEKEKSSDKAEYQVFTNWEEAERYLRSSKKALAVAKSKKRKRKAARKAVKPKIYHMSPRPGRYAPTPRWEMMFKELLAYQEKNDGSSNIVVTEDNFEPLSLLEAWVMNQRKQFREYIRNSQSKHHSMTPEKLERLKNVGFDFGPPEGTPGKRPERNSKKGDATEGEDDERDAKRAKSGKHVDGDSNNKDGSDGGNVTRNKNRDHVPRKGWMDMLEKLKEFKEANDGSVEVPKPAKDSNSEIVDKELIKLRTWCLDQKASYIRWKNGVGDTGGMTQTKVDMLVELGFELRSWNDMYAQLLEYKAREGTAEMPTEDDGILATWVKRQREAFSRHLRSKPTKLTKQQVDQLIAVGLQPITRGSSEGKVTSEKAIQSESDEAHFNSMIDQLRWYKIEHGDTNIPLNSGTELSKWVAVQRREFDKLQKSSGKPSTLTASRLQRLSELSFQFKPRGRYIPWEDRMCDLRKYKDTFGDIKITTSHPTLGGFIKTVRRSYRDFIRGRPSCLTKERHLELIELGFVFQAQKSPKRPDVIRTWIERFQELVAFKEEFGHTVVPQLSGGLGEWVHAQRGMYKKLKAGKKSQMSLEKALKLAELGFCFDASQRFKGARNQETTEFGE